MTPKTVPGARRSRMVALGAVLILIAVPLAAGARSWPAGLMRDFTAFYCAGAAIDRGADPYLAEPLGSCERSPRPQIFRPGMPGLAMPAPLPPFALAPFAALARIPYVPAALLWSSVIVASLVATIAALRSVTGLPLVPLIAALALGDFYASLCLGQIAPLAVAAIAVSACLLATGRDRPAALVATLAMMEPHVGLPLCLGLFVWRPRTRLLLVGLAVAAGVVSLGVSGTHGTLEYARAVVPAHAASEVANPKQFSLTYLLHRLGLTDAAALRAGELWYVAMLALGVAVAGAAARRGRNPALIAAIPPAFAVLGGPFVHIVQIAAAMPAGLILWSQARGPLRTALGTALLLLGIPFVQFTDLGLSFVPLAALTATALGATLVDRRPLSVAAVAAATIAFLELLIRRAAPLPNVAAKLAAAYRPQALAEQSWALYVHAIGSVNAGSFDLAKLPTTAGLLALTVACVFEALRSTSGEQPTRAIAFHGKGPEVPRRIALRCALAGVRRVTILRFKE